MNTLEKLPERMTALESQIVQFRTEMRDEFSAIRQEMRTGDEEPGARCVQATRKPGR